MIPLKSEKEIEVLIDSGKILSEVLGQLKGTVAAGITTLGIDRLAEELIVKAGAIPAFKGYKGYPSTLCVSINEEIVHGIPSDRKITEGDIVSIDIGVNYKGYFTDAAVTLPVGKVDAKVKKLIDVTRKALEVGIKEAKVDNKLFDISYKIQNFVEKNGFSVVRQFVGHGIGTKLHEEPEIPNFGLPGKGPILKSGMVLAIEPMVNLGTWEAEYSDNGWTATTKDKLPSAHFEHTVVITKEGPKVLTI